MKKVLAILLALLLVCLAGCARRAEQPGSSVPGYYGQQQSVEGGSGQKGANLREIEQERVQEDVVLTLRFIKGAGAEGGGALEKLPGYSVELLTAPSRLKVVIPGAMCEALGQEIEPMGELLGMIAEADEGGVVLYFQFTGQVAYKVQEGDSELVLRVRADDAQGAEQYHVKIPYREASAALAAEKGMEPALCDDGMSAYYLSGGFAEIADADALCKELNDVLEAQSSDDTAEVIALDADAAPVYTEPVSRALLTMMGALKTESGVVDGELVAMDARFLCWADDGSMVMARPQREVTGDGVAEQYEEIWVYHPLTGRREQLIDAAFSSVQKAELSRDGRYIAVMELSDGARLMYLYDRLEDSLLFLSAEGLGDYTADFAWGTNGRLYLMSGDDSMQLMCCDPALLNQRGAEAVTAVEEREGGYGNVGAAGGKVYFSDETGSIYAVDAGTGERVLFDEGDGFLLSPDGEKMVVIDYEESETGSVADLMLCDLTSGLCIRIASQAAVSDYVWSGDGEALLYLTSNKGAADAEDYPVRLKRYTLETGVTEDLGALASNSIFPGRGGDGVIVMFYQERDGLYTPITYALDLSGGVLSEEDELIVTIDGD
ncbi:MAG: hypothetical protein ACI4XW_01970 [Candidatus Spyradocola sp.]